jgi:hypothetical protein
MKSLLVFASVATTFVRCFPQRLNTANIDPALFSATSVSTDTSGY